MKEALFYKKLEDNKVQCQLCPQNCIISEGKSGLCFGRTNIDGKLIAENYGKTISISLDPIEKKPLYHFYPGTDILSIGPNGCNLRCQFCQNYQISQKRSHTKSIQPEEIVRYCEKVNSIGIAFTYTEPLVWYEFILDSAKLLRKQNKKVVLITNGTINEEPLLKLLPFVDAMNIDLKAMSEEFYKKYCSGFLETVKATIKVASQITHVEITYLLIPDLNDSEEEIHKLVDFIAELDKKIPLHFSRYFPRYKLQKPITSEKTMKIAYKIAKEKLDYVYVGNIFISGTANTHCPQCGESLIERSGYDVFVRNITQNNCCKKCGYKIKGVHLFA
ncbi:MAG: AmmeMemoRadiSam system radical SAM enzyme [Candidatus Cloacimonadota bacterium]|nr:AmmeMemoRadiSam system radical SAM enzyme [Candidatus Cloacimonadota bacterium]